MKTTVAALRSIAFTCLVLLSTGVSADSWLPPTTKATMSANGQFRVTVTPRPLSGRLDYFADKVEGEEPAGQPKGEVQKSPIARVERLEADGTWHLVWQMPLVNDVAPVSALLADDASFLVTFDNWHSAGYGDDVVVIYNRQGDLVRKLSLEQILPPAYANQIPRSVSSRWWGQGHALVDGDRHVELKVVSPGEEEDVEPKVPLRIRLVDGAVVPPTGEAWDRALAEANRLEGLRQEAWENLRKLRSTPLEAPATGDTRAWRRYLFELRDRIEGEKESMGVMVLAARGEDPGYHDADDIAEWVKYYDKDENEYDTSFILGSPTSDRLATLLVKAFRGKKEGSMTSAHLVFVGTAAEGAQVREAGKRTGAKITLVDRTTPYPAGKLLPEQPHPLWEAWDP